MIIRFMRIPLLVIILYLSLPELSLSKELELVSVGVRGAVNFRGAGLPPGEKENFEQFDVFGVLGFPGSWELPAKWEARYRLNGTVGVLRGAGDEALISTLTPGLAFTKKDWRLTLDFGGGGALLSEWKFGRQNIGGPFQFIGHRGIIFHLSGNLLLGYRFHHMSDATIYRGGNRGVDLHMLEFSYFFGDD